MRSFVAATLLTAFGLGAGPVLAEGSPVVVELFTSQGCSSCPPADAMMHDLAARDDVIALAFHVDYWDYIGWADTWGSPENTARQHAYARAANSRTVYTPQFVIGGVDHVIGARGMELADAINAQASAAEVVTLEAAMDGSTLTVRAEATAAQAMTLQVIRYAPSETVDILRGENAGETITYANTVMAWDVLTEWDGAAPLELQATLDGALPSVVIVQTLGAGPILAAVDLQ